MICVFCTSHVDSRRDADDLAWIHTFWWRLRAYEGPVCSSCTLHHLSPRIISDGNGNIQDVVLSLDDNERLPALALLLTSERTNKSSH
jgi:hypothetical protein